MKKVFILIRLFINKKMSFRLSFLLILIVFAVDIQCKPVPSSDKLTARINHLIDITESEKKFNTILNDFIGVDPNLALFKDDLLEFINKHLTFQSLRPLVVDIYREVYTLPEINGMIKFYSSPIGKKINEKEGKAAVLISQAVRERIQKLMPQITAWFQEKLTKGISQQ